MRNLEKIFSETKHITSSSILNRSTSCIC